jgi:hypothetical protein
MSVWGERKQWVMYFNPTELKDDLNRLVEKLVIEVKKIVKKKNISEKVQKKIKGTGSKKSIKKKINK